MPFEPQSTPPHSREIGIMAVDDDPFRLELVTQMLVGLGYSNVSAHLNGADALEQLNSDGATQIILLDLNMPKMDGVEFVRHLAAQGFGGELIFLSAEDEVTLRTAKALADAHHLRVRGVEYKPISRVSLGALLETGVPAKSTAPGASPSTVTEASLRVALKQGQLLNHYQPKVWTRTGEVIGVEALVRWNHPQAGLIYPSEFVPLAEETGLIHELTRQVVVNAVEQAVIWRDAGLSLSISINVTMADLSSPGFTDLVIRLTCEAGLRPESIALEVTESQSIPDWAVILDALARLRLHRHRLAIDDFGTGHSSLVHLRDLPFDEIKIDRTFTHNACRNRHLNAFFESTRDLASRLGIGVVAEGVETSDDWNFVRSGGDSVSQGYFISHPMPADEFPAWLEGWDRRLSSEGLLTGATSGV